jgi:hypothetical protein
MSHPPSYEELNALWEDHQGNQKRFTYNDLRVCSNTIAHFLDSLRISPRCPRLAVADSRLLEQCRRIPGQIHGSTGSRASRLTLS